jgi:hypothetical protein
LFAIVAWSTSKVAFPLFVARYFTPSLIIGFALKAALSKVLVEFCRTEIIEPQTQNIVRMLALAPPALLVLALLYKAPLGPRIPCTDEAGAFFEDRFVREGLPIIVESPHVWFPCVYYSQHRSLYLFPLDWEAVLKFPERATNNATNFNIMKRFKRFAGLPTILSTDDIIRDYPQFLVVNESSRAWFQKLSDVKRVTADKLPVAGSVFARL